MDEKKLNEEDTINGLRCMAGQKACDLCKYNDLAEQGEGTCMNLVAEDTLELISEQKAEIERLKKRHGVALLRNDDLDLENYELKKQVDELKRTIAVRENDIGKLESEVDDLNYELRQAVKETAKEIYQMLKRYFGNSSVVTLHDIQRKIEKMYGVEVE